jgi:exosome complex exonuclease DIS3/RRP44
LTKLLKEASLLSSFRKQVCIRSLGRFSLVLICFSSVVRSVRQEIQDKNRNLYNRLVSIVKAKNFYIFPNEHHRWVSNWIFVNFSYFGLVLLWLLSRSTYIERLSTEKPEERNERAVRVTARWFINHFKDVVDVVLVTNDEASLAKARFLPFVCSLF